MPTRHPKRETRHPRGRRRRGAGGFTLIEAALTTVIIGTGVLAILAAQQAYHRKNNWAQRTGTAMLLANELRERMVHLPLRDPQSPGRVGPEENGLALYDDVDDFAADLSDPYVGKRRFCPPIDALGQSLDEVAEDLADAGTPWDRWAQEVEVRAVDPFNPASSYALTELGYYGDANNPGVRMMRVTVRVTFDGEEMSRLSWLATD